jgi:hypothetical protein
MANEGNQILESEERWHEFAGKRCTCCQQKLTYSEYQDLGGLCLACVAATDPDRD